MGGSSTKSSTTTVGPGKAQLAQFGPGRIEDQYQADVAANRLAPLAQQYGSDVLSGKYLDPNTNPHLGNLTNSIWESVAPNVSSVFSRAGRGTSANNSGLGGALTRGFTSAMAGPLFQQYNQGLGLQQGMAQMAAPLDAAQSIPLEQYLERARGLASMDTSSKQTTNNPTQTIAGIGLMALGAMTANPMLMAGGASVMGGQGLGGAAAFGNKA